MKWIFDFPIHQVGHPTSSGFRFMPTACHSSLAKATGSDFKLHRYRVHAASARGCRGGLFDRNLLSLATEREARNWTEHDLEVEQQSPFDKL
jgi:hypothetical protein